MNQLNIPSTVMKSLAVAIILANGSALSHASSHREAPMIAGLPRLDATDLYMFRSYEEGRSDYVTILANYIPLQHPYGGPNYYDLETEGKYMIHIDNDGDSVADLTFTFDFSTLLEGISVPIGDKHMPIPLINIGQVGPDAEDTEAVNSRQVYTLTVTDGDHPAVRGDKQSGGRTPASQKVMHAGTQATSFRKPLDYIGTKSIPEYEAYANDHIYPIMIPGCSEAGRVFVGQRNEGFAANLGQIFDLVNLNPLGAEDAVENPLDKNNVTSLALELPISCLTEGDPVIGAWTTADLDMGKGRSLQVSRLGFPLVNELVIGLPDKNEFNASRPVNDIQFFDYVTHPTLPFLLETLFPGVVAPPVPRDDLVLAIGGIPGLNAPQAVENGTFPPSEMLRLNTAIDSVPAVQQMNMGVLDGDIAGFPNGRRPGDDVVDVVLRVMMGALINDTPPFTDQTTVSAMEFQSQFPYLNTPLPGSEYQQQ